MSELFDNLKKGLEEVVAFEKGKKRLRSKLVKAPKPPQKYTAKGIKRVRKKAKYTQNVFASVLNVSIKTVQSWESGVRVPSHVAMRLLEIVDKGIYRPKIY